MGMKPTLIIILMLLLSRLAAANSFSDTFRAGPAYQEKPGEVAVVVEVPPGTAPKASSFHLVSEGKRIADGSDVKTFEESGKGLALVICVDASGTMKGGPLKETRDALLSLLGVAAKRAEDRFALVSFADDARIESEFEEPREKLADTVVGLKAGGRYSRLYHALYRSLDMLQSPGLPKRRAILVISDGKVEGDTETLENVVTKAKALGISVLAVGRGKVDDQYLQLLSGIAQATGGSFVEARPDILGLKDALSRVYRELLETRSLVVYFRYQGDPSLPPLQNAGLEMERAGEKGISAAIPEAIAAPLQSPPAAKKGSNRLWGFIVALIAAVVTAVSALFIRRRPEPRTADAEPLSKPSPAYDQEHLAAETDAISDIAVTARGQTVVGGYLFPVPQPGRPVAALFGVGGPTEGKRFPVDKETFHIGAAPENDLHLAEDQYVSGAHAYLQYQKGTFIIHDKGSLNGTFVNGEKMRDQLPLVLGDRIRVGQSTFRLEKPPG